MVSKAVAALGDWSLGGWQRLSFSARQIGANRVEPTAWRSPGGEPILLLPGVWERWSSLIVWAEALHQAGWDVRFAPQVDLELGSLPELANRLLEELDYCPLVVAHSKGGLVAKQTMILSPRSIRGLIAVGTPFSGSPLARLMPRASGMSDLSPDNESLVEVGREPVSSGRTVLIEAQWDQDVPHAGHHRFGAYCTVPVVGHNALLSSPIVAQTICRYAAHIREQWSPPAHITES